MDASKIKTKLKQTGIKNFILECLNAVTLNKADFNWRCRVLKKDIHDYYKLKKDYGDIVNKTDWNTITQESIPKKIWICWFQGEKEAPEIVKVCLASVREIFQDYQIIIITNENISKYVNIPEFINKKREQGNIGEAHYSDILRLEILTKYGGIWLDATVLCTSRKFIEQLIANKTALFVFKDFQALNSSVAVSNWCIVAKKNHPYLVTVKNMLLEYWKNQQYPCNYFIFHIFFMIVAELNCEQWNQIPTYSNQPPHILQSELFKVYEKCRYKQIIQMSDIHKLSYKFSDDKFQLKNTMYDYLKSRYLEKKE